MCDYKSMMGLGRGTTTTKEVCQRCSDVFFIAFVLFGMFCSCIAFLHLCLVLRMVVLR